MIARPDSFAVAAEHVAWCLKQGMTLDDLHRSLACGGWHCPPFRSWNDALWAIAAASDRLTSNLAARGAQAHHAKITAAMPFRRREPARRAA